LSTRGRIDLDALQRVRSEGKADVSRLTNSIVALVEIPWRPYNAPWMAMRKEERIGVRVPVELKKALIQIAKAEDRSLAQVCEIFLRGGALSYNEEGPRYFQRLLSRQR